MTPRSARRLVGVCTAVCAALMSLSVPASADDPATLRARAAAVRKSMRVIDRQLAAALAKFEAARDAETRAIDASFAAAAAADRADQQRSVAAGAAAGRIRALYMSGGQLAVMATVLQAPDLHDALARYQNAAAVIAADDVRVGRLTVSADDAAKARRRHQELARESVKLARKAQQAAGKVNVLLQKQADLLARTDVALRTLLEEEARKARELAAAAFAATPGAGPVYRGPNGTFACPVGATHSFVDTWGAPRSGGRRHQGTDVFAPYGSPAYAVVDGVVDKWGNGGLGGITLWLRADNGDRFYYAHNSVNLARVGQRVKAGDVVARVGNTGNAATTPPHIHFEAHPGGGAAQNPYPFLKTLCG